MRLIIKTDNIIKQKNGVLPYNEQILSDAEDIPNIGDTLIWNKNCKNYHYEVIKREWFMCGEDYEKKLTINRIYIKRLKSKNKKI